jgi:tetratricopeptide (TPR) repeat protein
MQGRLKLEAALRALPEVDDLVHLREALVGASREDGDRAWAASRAYATLDTRLADPAALEAQVPALAERARARVEAVLRASVRALAALESGDAAAAARALVEAGEAEEEDGRLAEAAACYRQALMLGRRPRDRSAEGLALRRLGRVARERGDLEAALRYYRQGYGVAEAQRDVDGAVVACQGLGNVHVDQGMWEGAREWYERGLALLMDRPPERALWQLYSNLAVVARRRGDLDASAAWLDRAEAVARELGDPHGVLPVENGRAMLLVARGRLDEAEAAYRRSLEGQGSPSLRGSVLVNLAECLLLKGSLREAEAAGRELERTAVVHRLAPLLPYVYRGLGAIARARGDDEGFVFYEQVLDLCRDGGYPPIELAVTQHDYALLETGHGRLESAAARLEEALSTYRRLGTRPETERAEADLAAVRARMELELPDDAMALTTRTDGRT